MNPMPDLAPVAGSEARRHVPSKTWRRHPGTREDDMRALQIAAFALAAGILTTPAQAAPWPQRSVRFIAPIGPGTALDLTARLFADRLAARWGPPVVVENRPGGDTIIGVSAFARANDDHTLLFSISSPAVVLP